MLSGTSRTAAMEKALCASRARRRSTLRKLCTLSPRTERSEEHTSELQSRSDLVCRLLLEKKKPVRVWGHRRPLQGRHDAGRGCEPRDPRGDCRNEKRRRLRRRNRRGPHLERRIEDVRRQGSREAQSEYETGLSPESGSGQSDVR